MRLVRKISLILFGLNVLVLSIFILNQSSLSTGPNHRMMAVHDMKASYASGAKSPFHPSDKFISSLRFDNPAVAYEILTQLDVFSTVEDLKGANYTYKVKGMNSNYNYCNEHRAYFVSNPESVFSDKYNYVTGFAGGHQLRKSVLKLIGYDKTHYFPKGDDTAGYVNGLAPDNNIFLHFILMFYNRQVGKQFSCLTQASNHIAGHEKLYRKDLASQALVDYAQGYEDRPHCFGYNKYFPKTWVLRDKAQCEDFFREFNSPLYQEMKKERNVVYFRKIGANVHEGKGVFPVNDKEENYITEKYKNGSSCGLINDNNLIQYNVHNLLLVKDRKFGFRSFLFVASTNPLIAYYHDGYTRLSLNEYDSKSNETSTFVTNIGVNVKNPAFAGWSKRQIDEYTCWSMKQFADHLYEEGIVSDPDWLDNHLRKEFMKVKIHLLRMSQKGFYKVSSLFEIYGLDYVMDENLNLWFIEANTMPLMEGFTTHTNELFHNLMVDAFEIISSLMKSRAKRIIYYINNIIKKEGEDIKDIEAKKEEFRRLTMNYFEPEFQPRANSTFYKIIDENLSGVERYEDLIEEDCLAHPNFD